MNELITEKGLIQIFTNPLSLILVMGFILFIGYVLGRKKWIRKDNNIVSFIIYLSTFLGIVGMTYDNRNFILNIDHKTIQERIEINYQIEFLNQIERIESYLSNPFVRSKNSPMDFDELQKERLDFYEWIVMHREYMEVNVKNLEYLHEDSLNYPIIKDAVNIHDLDYIQKNVKDYNLYLSKYKDIQRLSYKNSLEIIVSFFYPLLFTIGLALQIVKECFLPNDRTIWNIH